MKKIILILCTFLTTAIYAQDVIVTNDGDAIKAYEVEVGNSYVYYQIDPNSQGSTTCSRIKKDQVLIIKYADGKKLDPNAIQVADTPGPSNQSSPLDVEWIKDEECNFPEIDIKNYKGYLLQKGNCVYIPHDSPNDYERAGQNYLYKEMKKMNYWTVVNKPEQAHFILIFFTKTGGLDKTGCSIFTRELYDRIKFEPDESLQSGQRYNLLYEHSDTDIRMNIDFAQSAIKILNSKLPDIENQKLKSKTGGRPNFNR